MKCVGCHLSWVLTKLLIEVRMVVRIHAALENLSILASVKEPCRDPQRAYAITAAQASRILLHFDIAAVPSKLCGDRSLRDQLQICEPPFVDFIAPRSRELLASRREVLQTLTSCRYSQSLAAVGLCRESIYVFGPSGREECECKKSDVGYDKPIAGHRKFCRVKSCSSAGPPASPSLDRIKICCEK